MSSASMRFLSAGKAVAEVADLERFLWAQDGVIDQVLEELRQGRKTSHWMWFVFPQVVGLGHSATAQRYAIRSLDEACAYLAHPTLGARLRDCCRLLLSHRDTAPEEILGVVDALKLRSCMTLFQAASSEPVFDEVLDAFYQGQPDSMTLAILGQG